MTFQSNYMNNTFNISTVKKLIFKVLKVLLLIFITIFISATIYIFFTGPKLPENTDQIVKEVINSPIPEFVKGKTGFVKNGKIKIWYESISPEKENKGTILLFMGISNDALGWPQTFLDKLTSSGHLVIRYDYRGTGFSDWCLDWKKNPYSLKDLATDAKIILDSLNVKKVNLVGVSLGGMVAQEFAINFPDRSMSLTSIMSSGNILDKNLPPISKKIVAELIKVGIKYGIKKDLESQIKMQLAARTVLKGSASYDIDLKGISQQVIYNIKKRNGINPQASPQHHKATYESGSRYDKLKDLKMQVLIMHGLNDPFIPVQHSKYQASIIPKAKIKYFKNMGHDFPPYLEDSIVNEIDNMIDSIDKIK